MRVQGIDVSAYQGIIDWDAVVAAGVRFAILRCHERRGIDEQFERNYSECKARGIPIGAYKYSYAKTEEQAEREADMVLTVLKGKTLELPVFYDLEWEEQLPLGSAKIGKIGFAFIRKINTQFITGVYSGQFWRDKVLTESLRKKDAWVASYAIDDTGVAVSRLKPSGCKIWQYSRNGRVPGIDGPVDMDYCYKDYGGIFSKDQPKTIAKATPASIPAVKTVTADDVINTAWAWLGRSMYDGTHIEIIDLYNSHTPLARGYKVGYKDHWCDTFVSAVFIKLGATDLIGTECGVEEHVKIFKAKGIWEENGAITPDPGDIIVFNWDSNSQPNDGYSDHIGIVESVSDGCIHTIEGNANGVVGRRQYKIGHGNIRGFAKPRYGTGTPASAPVSTPASTPAASSGGINKTPTRYGTVVADVLNVRKWAGVGYPNLTSIPQLTYGASVGICDTIKDTSGNDWHYAIVGKDGSGSPVYGFVCAAYVMG